MTVSSFKKMFRQLRAKPIKLQKYTKHNTPKNRNFGKASKKCVHCGNNKGFVAKYGLDLCRKCFRDMANSIGFKKFS